jgi:hypothetical protein
MFGSLLAHHTVPMSSDDIAKKDYHEDNVTYKRYG